MTKQRKRKPHVAGTARKGDEAGVADPGAIDESAAIEAEVELAEELPTRFADLDEDARTHFADEWVTAPIVREAPELPPLESPTTEPSSTLDAFAEAQDELAERAETRTSARHPLRFVGPLDGGDADAEAHLEDRFDFGSPTAEHPAPGQIEAGDGLVADALGSFDTPPDPGSADAGSPRLQSIVESVLFAAERPMSLRSLADLVEEPELERIRAAVLAVEQSWRERGVQLHEVAGGYQFRTHPSNAMWVQKLLQQKPVRLSRALLETLAIVSYRQPITRPEIDEIRGVDSGGTLKTLMDRALVRVLGKKEEPGRPLLYGTTNEFLEFFSLRDLKDLPTLREYHELSEEHQAQVAALEEAAPEGSIIPEGEPEEPGELPKLSRLEISAPREDALELEEIDRLIRTAGTTVATDSDLPASEDDLVVTGTFPPLPEVAAAGDFDEERQLTSTYGDPLPDPATAGEEKSEFPEQAATQFRGEGLDSSLIDGRDPGKEPKA